MISYHRSIKFFWTKIEDLKNIELNVLPVYYDRYLDI